MSEPPISGSFKDTIVQGIGVANDVRIERFIINNSSDPRPSVVSGSRSVVHYMVGDIPDHFVHRPKEYDAAKAAILAGSRTIALQGAGGYGKTTLANALCRDPDIQREFSGGVLRVELSKEIPDVTSHLLSLIGLIDPGCHRLDRTDCSTAADLLAEVIGENRILLVIDDVWRRDQLTPFLRGGPNCVRLVTTRLLQLLPTKHVLIGIDQMARDEGLAVLSGVPVELYPALHQGLYELAERLGYWAQMLAVSAGWIAGRITRGEQQRAAIREFETRLIRRGLTAFDPANERQRSRAISICFEASLEELDSETERRRLEELAVLPDATDVPITVVASLWAASAEMHRDEADDLLERLAGLSLVRTLDRGLRTVRLHDNMLWYLRDRIAAQDKLQQAHATMVRAIEIACGGDFAHLSPHETYFWRHVVRHLRGAGQDHQADQLMTNYSWIRAKLHAVGPSALLEAYLADPENSACQLVGRTISLAATALAINPHDLPRQIFGRLGDSALPVAITLVTAATSDPDFWPIPRWSSLTPPGVEQLRLIHEGEVTSAAFSPDGKRIITASRDRTARIWDARSGEQIAAIHHPEEVENAAFSLDGETIITNCHLQDGTNYGRIRDAHSLKCIAIRRDESHQDFLFPGGSDALSPDGECIAEVIDGANYSQMLDVRDSRSRELLTVLRGHEGEVQSVAFSPNGKRIVTASSDRTARIWDARCCLQVVTRYSHIDRVVHMAFSPDGKRIVTASFDRTACIWDAHSGKQIVALQGHGDAVEGVAFSPDGKRIVTASRDHTARIWDAYSGKQIVALQGHERWVRRAVFSRDGKRIVTASDRTTRFWDARNGKQIAALQGPDDRSMVLTLSPDGKRIATSRDELARIWDTCSGREIVTLHGHEGWVRGAEFSRDGRCIATASSDHTARIWDAHSGKQIAALKGHDEEVQSVAFSFDGDRMITGSWDRTARLWDMRSEQQIACIVLDAAVLALAVSRGVLAVSDALGGLCVLDMAEPACLPSS